MKDWQRKHVLDNFDKLLSSTRCYAMLISTLIAKNILDISDWDMESMKYNDRYKQADKLYEILMTRENAYEELIQALQATNQLKAVEILLKCYESIEDPIPTSLVTLQKSIVVADDIQDFKTPPAEVLKLIGRHQPKNFLIISATNAEITEMKIKQTIRLPSFPVHFTKTLKQFLQEHALNFEESQMIVVTCPNKGAFKSALADLRQQKLEDHAIKLVIITEETIKDIDSAVTQFQLDKQHAPRVTDDLEWDDLTENGKSKLLQRQILLQGYGMPLKDICSDPNLLKILSGKMLAALLNDEEPEIFSEVIPSLPSYYIQRQLRSKRFRIPLNVIEEDSTDVFVISNIDVNELRKFKQASGCIAESTGIMIGKHLSAQRFIILANENHFDVICKKTPSSVHWLRYHKTHFEWIKTHGSISLMQEYTRDAKVDLVGENEFIRQCDNYNNPILISETPGMGKTILCKSLSRQLKQLHPSRLVLHITMSEFISQLNQLFANHGDERFKHEDIVELLLPSKSYYNPLMQQQMINWLHDTDDESSPCHVVKCEVLFDGFDEVLPYQRKLAKNVLVWFGHHRNNFRVWVTTRPAHLRELEMTLTVLGHNIRPFQRAEAREFLMRYWLDAASSATYDKDNENRFEIALMKFADSCIEGLNSKLDNFAKGITGIPLQCFMLSYIYETDAIEYATVNSKSVSKTSTQQDPQFNPINSVIDLYDKMRENKFSIFFNKKNLNLDPMDPIFLTLKMKLDKIYFRLSVQLLFPKWSESMKTFLPLLTQDEYEEALAYGIVESYNSSKNSNQLRFIHRTFAEYYFALFAANLLSQPSKSEETAAENDLIVEFVFGAVIQMSPVSDSLNVIPNFRNPVIIHFFNEILHQYCITCAPIRSLKASISSYKKAKEFILGCLTSGRLGIFQILISSFNNNELIALLSLNAISGAKLLELFSSYSSTQHFSNAITFLNSLKISIDKPSFKKILLSAVENGNVDVVHYIISNNLETSDWENIHILHRCLKASLFCNDPNEISKLQNVMSCLVSHNRSVLEEKDEHGCPPLIASDCIIYTPYEITDHLVKLGADVNVTCNGSNILEWLFHKSPATIEKQVKSFLLLKEHGLNIANIESPVYKLDFSVMFPFLAQGVSDLCPEIAKIANSIQNVLEHHLRLVSFDLDILYSLHLHSLNHFLGMLSDLKIPITYANDKGETFLYVTMRPMLNTHITVREDIVDYLLSNGADPNQTNDKGEIPLQFDFFPVSLRILQLFNSHGGNILGKDGCESIQTYLRNDFVNSFHYPCYPVVSYLIDNGADINCKTENRGESLLHLAVKTGCLETVKLLIDVNPGLVNTIENYGHAPLHYAVLGNVSGPVCVYERVVERRKKSFYSVSR